MSAATSAAPRKTPKRWRFRNSTAVHGVFGHSTYCGKYREHGEEEADDARITCGACLARARGR